MVDTKKHLRHCNLCGREYRYCGNCSEFKHLPPYMIAYCGEGCKDIDAILSNWGAKIIDSATAAELLKSKDLSRMEFWNNSYKAAYAQIMEDIGTPIVKEPEPVNEDHKEEQKEEIKQEKTVRRYSKKKKDDDVLVQMNIANAIEK